MRLEQIGTIIFKDGTKILETKPINAETDTTEFENQVVKFFCQKLKEFSKNQEKK